MWYKHIQYISAKNKINKYIKFNKNDKVLAEYMDYIGFYGDYDSTMHNIQFRAFYKSDNSTSFNIGRFNITKERNRRFVNYSFMWYVVNISRIIKTKIQGRVVLKVDLFGKWIHALNTDKQRSWYTELLTMLWLNNIIITRTDYAVDCQKMNFRKKNRLQCKISWLIEKNGELEYLTFGRKGKSAHFIRYYDKKKELLDKGTLGLYPQYHYIDTIMRYELQINGEWLDDESRSITIHQLEELATFGYEIQKKASEYHQKRLDLLVSEEIEKIKILFNKLKKSKNIQKIQQIQTIYNEYFKDLLPSEKENVYSL